MERFGNFEFEKTKIEGLLIIKQREFVDHRGFFMETYHREAFNQAGIKKEFVQDNFSYSTKGVLRGLHYQKVNPQGKLVRALRGTIYDVAVDLRRDSSTYGEHVGIVLSDENRMQFYLPEGLAHGFLVLSQEAEVMYKCTHLYEPENDSGIIWNDGDIGVEWPLDRIEAVVVSDKDQLLPTLSRDEIRL